MKYCNVLDLLQGNPGELQCGEGGGRRGKIDKVFTIVEFEVQIQRLKWKTFEVFHYKRVMGVSWIKICHCTSLRGPGFPHSP